MTFKNLLTTAFVLALFVGFTGCGDDDDDTIPTSNLTLNLTGLSDLGADYVYEGWVIVDGSPISTGTFTSTTFPQTFSVNTSDLTSAANFVLTIEPAGETGDASLAPAATKLLSGAFNANSADLTINDQVGDFTSSSGTYILATPTDNLDNNESGIWWLDNTSGSAVAGLDLPDLSGNAGWIYEGWVIFEGTPVSTGTFEGPSGSDSFSGYSGTDNPAPGYPGEDFLNGTVGGVTLPADLRGRTVAISVEPVPDNSDAPFFLKPILHGIPMDALFGTPISANNNAASTNATGTATR